MTVHLFDGNANPGSNIQGIVSNPAVESQTQGKTASPINAEKVIITAQSYEIESPEKLITSDIENDPNLEEIVHENCKLNEQYLREYNQHLDSVVTGQRGLLSKMVEIALA